MSSLPWMIIGAGRVGRALAIFASEHDLPLRATWNRSAEAAAATRALLDPQSDDFDAIHGDLERMREVLAAPALIWLTVSDDALEQVATTIAPWVSSGSIVLHTCGSISSRVMRDVGVKAPCGSLHPLLAIADPHKAQPAMAHCAWTIEGDDAALLAARSVCALLGVTPREIRPEAKALYHASAVTIAGLLVSLADASFEMARLSGLSQEDAREMLLPLATSCIENLYKLPPSKALTGPVARGDHATIARHKQALLAHPELAAIYDILDARAKSLAASDDRGARELE